MIRPLSIKFFIVSILLFLNAYVASAPVLALPIRRVPLNDEMALLGAQDAQTVKRISQEIYRDLKSELAVLIIRSTKGENASNYAETVFNHWGLGQAAVNNGMLILFAIDDRRVEIKPGIRYKSYFNESFCTSLLTRYVVPEMRSGHPEKGVIAAAREVAAEIRRCEEALRNPGAANTKSLNAEMPITPVKVTTSRKTTASPSTVSAPRERFRLNTELLKFAFYGLIILGVAFGIFYYIKAFQHGVLLMPAWMFVLLMILSGFLIAGLGVMAIDLEKSGLDQAFSGAGGASLIVFLWCASHVCTRCNRYMNVHHRTLHYATYSSTGLGEKTEHCDNCGYHHVSTYTISRKTRSKSSSSSGGSSGGRSSGGGGGASW